MKHIIIPALFLSGLLLSTACSDQKTASDVPAAGAMKCGAGKCGANMAGGNAALAKKQQIILSQLREKDPRKPCVLNAKTVKALYDCVRDPETGRLSAKCGETKAPAMKCGAGKCGGN